MTPKNTTSRRPSAARRGQPRWTVWAAASLAAVLVAAGALTAMSAAPSAQQAEQASAAELPGPPPPPVPVPALGEPYLADLGNGTRARITVHSARYTAPTVLVLDVSWEDPAGGSTPDPAHLEVLDGGGNRAPVHPLDTGELPHRAVGPSTPARGKVAFDITARPAVLLVRPVGAAEPAVLPLGE